MLILSMYQCWSKQYICHITENNWNLQTSTHCLYVPVLPWPIVIMYQVIEKCFLNVCLSFCILWCYCVCLTMFLKVHQLLLSKHCQLFIRLIFSAPIYPPNCSSNDDTSCSFSYFENKIIYNVLFGTDNKWYLKYEYVQNSL